VEGNNDSAGRIDLADSAFQGTKAPGDVVHEIGHNWDSESENPRWNDFLALSGWRPLNPGDPVPPGYTKSVDSNWIYLTSESQDFVSDYAKTHPIEDFAESLRGRFAFPNRDQVVWKAKWDFIDDFLTSLRT
jgi:hypothetical protein